MARRGVALVVLIGLGVANRSLADEPKSHGTPERSHWAFTPPARPKPPAAGDLARCSNLIDAFILAALRENWLRPSVEADRATLLRRVTFDLTGLPPTIDEIDAFLNDPSPQAYEKQVDRLLASPHYGERLAQHWLDLARYADTDGFEFDQARPDAWRYRDWVARALSSDMRYDRFVALQLAGDEIDPENPDAFIATGFNRCYPDMVDLNDQGLRRQTALNDITETAGLVFLGLTIGCARCHDHKFDPIRLTEFYQLQAFFTPARFRDDYPVASAARRREYEDRRRPWERQLAEVQAALIRLETNARERIAPGLPPGLDDQVIAAFQKEEAQRSAAEVGIVFDALARDRRIKPDALNRALGSSAAAERKRLAAKLESLRKNPPPDLPRARGLDEVSPVAGRTLALTRGDFYTKGPAVEPAVPAVLVTSPQRAALPVRALAHSTGRRKALAEWLTLPENPLTSRVIVNRLWQHHFGRGIVATASDFGTAGEPPSHPELLDWLATELVRHGWSLKRIHRLIVTSGTYRQVTKASSQARANDPANLLLSHQNRRRLDGEAIRDALLAVSGQLNPALGGPGVFPELPLELTKLSSKGAIWPVSPRPEDRVRRSLYVFVRRNLRYPFFEAFDRPDTNASCPRRPVTTIAPQALSLLNGSLAVESASSLAERLECEARADSDARIEQAYRLALGRRPDRDEQRLARAFISGGGPDIWSQFCLVLLNVNEFVYLD
jgi:hypothetical protein